MGEAVFGVLRVFELGMGVAGFSRGVGRRFFEVVARRFSFFLFDPLRTPRHVGGFARGVKVGLT